MTKDKYKENSLYATQRPYKPSEIVISKAKKGYLHFFGCDSVVKVRWEDVELAKEVFIKDI